MRRSLACFAVSLLAGIALAAPARAADPAAPVAESEDVATTWYGYQTMAIDGVVVVLGVALAATHDHGAEEGLIVAGSTVYELGGPTVHFAHRHAGKGFVDLTLRFLLPTVGILLGTALALATTPGKTPQNGQDLSNAEVEGAAIAGSIGMVSASVIDAVFLAREPVVEGDAPASAPAGATKASLAPSFAVAPGGQGGGRAMLGIMGRF